MEVICCRSDQKPLIGYWVGQDKPVLRKMIKKAYKEKGRENVLKNEPREDRGCCQDPEASTRAVARMA